MLGSCLPDNRQEGKKVLTWKEGEHALEGYSSRQGASTVRKVLGAYRHRRG